MYKTVRQGENSLQYTILPQTEEVLGSSGMKGKGRDYSPSVHVKRGRKRSTFKYVLLLVFGAVVALALASVPLYLMNSGLLAVPVPTATQPLKGTPLLTYRGLTYDTVDVTRARNRVVDLVSGVVPVEPPSEPQESGTSATERTSVAPQMTTAAAAAVTVGTDRRVEPTWSMPAFKLFRKGGSAVPSTPYPPPIVEDRDELNIPNGPFSRMRAGGDRAIVSWEEGDVIIRPTASPEPESAARDVYGYVTRAQPTPATSSTQRPTTPPSSPPPSARTTFEDVLITTRASAALDRTSGVRPDKSYPLGQDVKEVKENILDDEEEFKDAEVDEVFSLPPLRREPGGGGGGGGGKGGTGWVDVGDDEVKVTKTSAKLRNLWGFNPATIFQWPDYSQEDSVVVPLLALTVTLLTVALGLTVAVAIRRHRQHDTGTHIGKLTADLQADDNTNLLTAESNEEE